MISKILNIALIVLAIGLISSYIYKMPKFSDGNPAPQFSAQTIEGQKYDLAADSTEFVLLHFWGTWCGPCRRENRSFLKQLASLDTSIAQSFRIVHLAIERDGEELEGAIAQDSLIFNNPVHIAQLDYFDSPIAVQYGVKNIPTSYLVDTKKKSIVAVNPDFNKITSILTAN